MVATANTTIQLGVPDELRGRVMSVYTTTFAGTSPIGGPVLGAIAGGLGVEAALIAGGVASALVGVGATIAIKVGAVPSGPPAWSAMAAAPRPATPAGAVADGTLATTPAARRLRSV